MTEVYKFIDENGGHADKRGARILLLSTELSEKTKAAYRLRVQQLKVQLCGSDPSPIVELMAGRVALAWLDAYLADGIYYLWSDGVAPEMAEFHDKRRGRAGRRLIAAVKALADVQRVKADVVHQRITRFDFARSN